MDCSWCVSTVIISDHQRSSWVIRNQWLPRFKYDEIHQLIDIMFDAGNRTLDFNLTFGHLYPFAQSGLSWHFYFSIIYLFHSPWSLHSYQALSEEIKSWGSHPLLTKSRRRDSKRKTSPKSGWSQLLRAFVKGITVCTKFEENGLRRCSINFLIL